MYKITAFCLLMMVHALHAQQYSLSLANMENPQVYFYVSNSDIQVEGYQGSEIIIEGASYFKKPERAKGLKSISQGEDNTGVGVNVKVEKSLVTLRSLGRQSSKYTIKIPHNASLILSEEDWMGSSFRVRSYAGDLQIQSHNSNIQLENFAGSVYAKSISGNIIANFADIKTDKSSTLRSVSGEVEVTLPPSTKAYVELKSVSGHVYSDFDFAETTEDGLRRIGGRRQTTAKLNGGGARLSLSSVSNNVVLRKGN